MLSAALFDETAALHGLSPNDRELLEHSALLHDIGEHVASSGHHKHGAYLIRNGQLRGFSPEEIELIAAVVRWHRRGEPRTTDEFPLLDADAIARVRVLDALLRVADGLDRSRNQVVQRSRRDDDSLDDPPPDRVGRRHRAGDLGRAVARQACSRRCSTARSSSPRIRRWGERSVRLREVT